MIWLSSAICLTFRSVHRPPADGAPEEGKIPVVPFSYAGVGVGSATAAAVAAAVACAAALASALAAFAAAFVGDISRRLRSGGSIHDLEPHDLVGEATARVRTP